MRRIETKPVDFEIDKVTLSESMLTGTTSITERTWVGRFHYKEPRPTYSAMLCKNYLVLTPKVLKCISSILK